MKMGEGFGMSLGPSLSNDPLRRSATMCTRSQMAHIVSMIECRLRMTEFIWENTIHSKVPS